MGRKPGSVTWRLWAVVAAMGFGTLVITGRLAQLQLFDHQQYAHEARLTHMSEQTLLDRRGALLDRNGYPLAASQDTYDVMVESRAWSNGAVAAEAAAALSPAAGKSAEEMLAAVQDSDIFEVNVATGLNYERAEAVRALRLSGVRLVTSSHRVYPEGNLAAQLLGFVGRDNTGLTGLEADLNAILDGSAGTIRFERDGLGNQFPLGERLEIAPQPGANVVLTIDRYIQRLAEQELDRTIKDHKATGGSIIVVEPATGEILAMASRPTFDVTRLDLSDASKAALYRNRAITDQYEPGSVFKLVTTAAGIDSGTVSPDTWWYDNGSLSADSWTIRNWDLKAYGSQTIQQMLSKSLNTGAAWVAQQVGPERFYDYVSRFGFGSPTEIGLSGESSGRVRTPESDPASWRSVDMATNSFGQGISVTPLQMCMAVAAIANNGMLVKPHIIRAIVSPNATTSFDPEPVRQAISPQSSQTLREMMGVVVDGISASYLDVQGYRVGGKTGTASVATDSGGYKPDAYISSFVGIAPVENPRLAVLVKIDEPKEVPWGTVVAAPAFGRLVQDALAYLKVPPTESALVSTIQ
ncbi:MAG TPA: penicillin-binding protein 2 [Dehalococcoidia bacterium]|nr:penicillin-binding protein 2 [Dehalococcoidia bacterium]